MGGRDDVRGRRLADRGSGSALITPFGVGGWVRSGIDVSVEALGCGDAGGGTVASAASAACRPWISGCRCCWAAQGQAIGAAVLAVAAGSDASKSSTAAGATAAC